MKRSKALGTVIIVCLVLLAGLGIVAGVYLKQRWDQATYFQNTAVNGFDASGHTPEEMLAVLTEAYSAPEIRVNEQGEEAMASDLAGLGYTVDQAALKERLDEVFERQKTGILELVESLLYGNSFQIEIPFSFDETVFCSAVNSGSLNRERVASVDAELRYDEEDKNYYIEPEIYGTEFEDDDLQRLVKEQLDALVSEPDPQPDLTVEVPESIYFKPQVTQDDVELNNICNIYNHYVKAEITYLFGDEKQVVDWEMIRGWLSIVDGEAVFDEEAMYLYVMDMAQKYNTIYYDRTFRTSYGETITIPGQANEYGYMIDEDAEYSRLWSDIQANAPVEREPVYSHSGYKRNGVDDLAGTYVEVNLSAQHLWAYVDGSLVAECDIVSGNQSKGTETQTGVFPVAYKESPSVLTGGNAENGWETPVQYWMPFYDGQGLHDASWRSAFGGSIYQTNGSHGCVNIPPAVMGQIYANIDTGVAIILYK